MKKNQQGFVLIESIISVVIFAISLTALLNYSQYITLNFNQLYKSSVGLRELHNTLEKRGKLGGIIPMGKIPSIDTNLRYPNWKIQQIGLSRTDKCAELMVLLVIEMRTLSLSRWNCSIGERHVSGLSL
ncbi:TPA: prepilin-type N-terminal cleavage/methylation domain-containing protein [Providencia rettgeri]